MAANRECFICSEPCADHIDFHCRSCDKRSHWVCTEQRTDTTKEVVRCEHCKGIFDEVTVGFWCLSAYERRESRDGTPYDVNYIKDGKYVAFIPYAWKDGRFHMQPAAISAQYVGVQPQHDWVVQNWYRIMQRLWAAYYGDTLTRVWDLQK